MNARPFSIGKHKTRAQPMRELADWIVYHRCKMASAKTAHQWRFYQSFIDDIGVVVRTRQATRGTAIGRITTRDEQLKKLRRAR
jgi:hypothetical protein